MTMVKAHVSAHELVSDRYRLLEVFARETNRLWWYAEDVTANQPRLVAQIALPETCDEDTLRRAEARVVRTSEIMRLLRPGRVATVVDAVVQAGTLWTVTEWIDGTPLCEFLDREGPSHPVRAARTGLELLDVLQAAHDEGITHGELSPGQVFVRDGGSVVVAGFGLAGATLVPRLTAPSYASPEQARDERIGPAADLWALGAILYTMVEGRPPFRDRGRPDATLKAVDRLPLRTPLRTGPLTRTVQGLLRKNSRERLTRPVVREALTRVLGQEADQDWTPAPAPRLRAAYTAVRHDGPVRSRQVMTAGTALAVLTVAAAVLAATHHLPGGSPAAAPSRPSATAATSPPADPAEHHTPGPSPSGSPSGSPRPGPGASSALPAGYHRYSAPEGFSVALPDDWKRLTTSRAADHAYRVTFGTSGGSPTLAVTYSERVGPDPVAVWRDDVEPALRRLPGYQRIGTITATTYQGHKAADLEWLSGTGGERVHTLGRGFLLGGRRGCSLRFTTPAGSWDDAVDRLALKTFLATFRPPAA
ncbi:serine/threonine protein kinase [Streptomyces griseochromogenes]|uniref:non-specific serine/threonine protein kinase n=1 Tax=Streptomyces griseochromogenes TaxID=68214 RepID=A0A1B1B1R2_9ACTN|nr:serine/threonine-protein kinase [Streptomyces griseochromogenes]ANP52757.1 serine/threonine protein kinase [Streptomyces griseochromogenes]MBP2047368.1 serine/threonine protein kinase [Streptomyces griseochromogenes]